MGLGVLGGMAAVFVLTALAWVTREGLTIGEWRLPGWNPALANLQAHLLEALTPDLEATARALSGRVAVVGLDDAPAAYAKVASRSADCVKIALQV